LKDNENVRVWIDFSILKALRLKAEGKTDTEIAWLVKRDQSNLSRSLKKFRERNWPLIREFVYSVEQERLLEKATTKREILIKKAEKGLWPGSTAPFGAVLKHGTLYRKPGNEYEKLLSIYR